MVSPGAVRPLTPTLVTPLFSFNNIYAYMHWLVLDNDNHYHHDNNDNDSEVMVLRGQRVSGRRSWTPTATAERCWV